MYFFSIFLSVALEGFTVWGRNEFTFLSRSVFASQLRKVDKYFSSSCVGWNLCSPSQIDTVSSHHMDQNSLQEPICLFKILEAHLFFCMDHTCNLIEIGHKGFCGLTLFAVHQITSCRTLYVRDGFHSDLLLIKDQGLMADVIHTVEASPGPDLADELACTGNHPQLQ